MKNTAIFITGPTASGKTSVAIELARQLDTEIISFDSRQFYNELKIGAAPPTPEEQEMAVHHLVGQLSLEDEYSAADFEADALAILKKIFSESSYAVLVGGSGLYMKALAEGFDPMPEVPELVRDELTYQWEEEGLPRLQEELEEKDPEYYAEVDIRNPQRIMRALEVIRHTGKTFSSFRRGQKVQRDFRIVKIALTMPREDLYERINKRVDRMLEAGLEEEVKRLLPYRNKNSMQTVGYREFIRYFDGELSRDEAIEEIKKNTRRYAKRQLTWFRRDEEIRWFRPEELDKMITYLKKMASKHGKF